MTLRTSSNKLNPAFNMFKRTVAANRGLLILLSVAMLIYSPGFILMRIKELETMSYSIDFSEVIQTSAYIITIAAGIAVVLFNLINFMYLYSKKSSDVFHSLPLTRTELLFSRGLAGFFVTLVPVLLGYISLLLISVFVPWLDTANNIPMILICLGYTVATMLVCSSFSAVFAISAGTGFDYMLSFLGFNGGILLFSVIIVSILENELKGYNSSDFISVMENLCPPLYCVTGLSDYLRYEPQLSFDDAVVLIRMAIYILVFTLLSVFLYNRRRAEKSGEAYAFKFIYVICAVVAGFCGAYCVGFILADESINIAFWIFALIGGMVTTVTYGAISNRGFKNFKHSIILGLSSVAIIAVIVAVVKTGCFGFTSRIPKAENIESATVRYRNTDIVFEDIELPLKLHKKIVDNLDKVDVETDTSESRRTYVYLTYELENGFTMQRSFLVETEAFITELLDIYRSDEHIDTISKAVKKSNLATAEIYLSNYFKNYDKRFVSTYLTYSELNDFLKVYKKDIKNASKDVIMERENIVTCDISWSGYGEYAHYELMLEDSFTETKAFIDSLNLIERQEEKNEETVVYYD